MRRRAHLVLWLGLSLLVAKNANALPQEAEKPQNPPQAKQTDAVPPPQKSSTKASNDDQDKQSSIALPSSFKGLGERFLLDQKQIWTSPAHLRWQDANWLLPLSGISTGLFITDSDMSRHISQNPTTISHYNTISNASVAALIGGAGAMWLFSYPKHNEHWRETGFLAGEAAINSLVVVEAMKYPLGRQRPYQGDGTGPFFNGGVSFPSEHSAAAWAVAGVVAHEYPGPLTKILVYSLASLVDYSRYRARQHFPSDVFIGSIIGNMVAENVYNQHHDPELGGSSWEPFRTFLRQTRATSSANMGSPYVPLDSWVYPAMDRLIAWALFEPQSLTCGPGRDLSVPGSLLKRVSSLRTSTPVLRLPQKFMIHLAEEFRDDTRLMSGGENTRAQLESAYTRVTGISGQPMSQALQLRFRSDRDQ